MRRVLSLVLSGRLRRAVCEATGHRWGPWSDSYGPRALPARTCRRCGEVEVA